MWNKTEFLSGFYLLIFALNNSNILVTVLCSEDCHFLKKKSFSFLHFTWIVHNTQTLEQKRHPHM